MGIDKSQQHTRPGTPSWAALFDLDGVLTDTAALHHQSWSVLADELGVPYDAATNDAMRGLGRPQSLEIFLRNAPESFSEHERRHILERKNKLYLDLVAQMGPADLFPDVANLLNQLRRHGVRIAIASSSRNAGHVAERLGIAPVLDALVDGNTVPHSKPDPHVFREAARQLNIPPDRCVVIEDAESGIQAARAANMAVVGVGPPERVGAADLVVPRTDALSVDLLASLVGKCNRLADRKTSV